MTAKVAISKKQMQHIYHLNPYVALLKMEIDQIAAGQAVMAIPAVHDTHGNLHGMVHGGALASLVDTAMGVSCVSLGKKVVTLEMNMNFIRAVATEQRITAAARVIHDGKSTMVAEADVLDEAGGLLAKARGTFFVIGNFEHGEK